MYLFTSDDFSGTLTDCNEGVLQWIPRDRISSLPQWEGDKIFLNLLLEDAPFFLLKLRYCGSSLEEAVLNGRKLL